MKISKLLSTCISFEKAAQTAGKIVLDPNKSNINFYSKFLYHAVGSYAKLFPTIKAAQTIYNSIANYNSKPAYGIGKSELQKVEEIQGAIIESSSRLRAAGVDPIDALKKMGMQNVHSQTLQILLDNLKLMISAQPNANIQSIGYRHYNLPTAGQIESIDLDEEPVEPQAGY